MVDKTLDFLFFNILVIPIAWLELENPFLIYILFYLAYMLSPYATQAHKSAIHKLVGGRDV